MKCQPQIPECLLKVSLKFLNEAQKISFIVFIFNFEKGEGVGGGILLLTFPFGLVSYIPCEQDNFLGGYS